MLKVSPCRRGPEYEKVADWPRSPVRTEAGGMGQACMGSHGYEGGQVSPCRGNITKMAARAAAPAPAPQQDSSSPLVWNQVKVKGHLWQQEVAPPAL